MAVNDFTGKNIQDTYQRVVQTDGTNLADGTGSLLPISFDGNNVIIEGNITAQTYVVSQSIINISSGSTIFGNSTDDTHQFTGSVDISNNLQIANDIQLADNSKIISSNNSTTFIELQNDDGFNIRANNIEIFSIFSSGVVVNDNGIAAADFRIESDNNTHIFFVDSGNNKIAIGTDTVGNSLLTVDGDITVTDITASGTISASIIQSNNIVGDTSQNTQLFVGGAITASGDISSSGTLIGNAVYIGGDGNGRITENSDNIIIKNQVNDKQIAIGGVGGSSNLTAATFDFADKSITTGTDFHITASGNIRGTMPQIISANMGSVNLSTENFIPLAEGELEGTNGDHPRVNLIAPFSGSLRRVVMRSNAAFGTSEFTASLHTIRPGGTLSSDKDTIGQCFVDTAAANNAYAVVFDFTNSVVGSNVIDGGDRVLIGVKTTRTNSQNYYFTSVFTWDYQETTGLQTTSTSTSGGSI